MSQERISFSVTGEHLMEFTRGIALEGRWNDAVMNLKQSLIGATDEQCEKVLTGEWRLHGDSDTGVLVDYDDGSDDYVRRLDDSYKDGFMHDGLRLSAKIRVKTLGPHDHMKVFGGVSKMTPENIYSAKEERAAVYMYEQRDDYVVLTKGDTMFVCVPQPAPSIASTYDTFDQFVATVGDDVRLSDWSTEHRAFHEEWPMYNGRYNAGVLDTSDTDELIAYRYIECEREGRVLRTIRNVKQAIIDFGDTDVVTLTFDVKGEEHVVDVPKAPLERWAYNRSDLDVFDSSWTEISPAGMKMPNDCGAHTDWIIASGFDPNKFYNTPVGEALNDAAVRWMFNEERNRMKVDALTLANPLAAPYDGTIVHAGIDQEYDVANPILVFPNGNVEYYNTMVFAARKNGGKCVVVLGVNSQLCHLVTNANETKGVTMVFVEDAREVLQDGAEARVDTKYGEIRLAR